MPVLATQRLLRNDHRNEEALIKRFDERLIVRLLKKGIDRWEPCLRSVIIGPRADMRSDDFGRKSSQRAQRRYAPRTERSAAHPALDQRNPSDVRSGRSNVNGDPDRNYHENRFHKP